MSQENEMKVFNTLREDFNNRSDRDPSFHTNVSRFNRLLQFTVNDTGNVYHFNITDGKIPEIVSGPSPATPNLTMVASLKHMLAILVGQINPAAALMHPQIKIRGSPGDLAFIKRFLLRETKTMRDLVKTMDL